ncbi:hypothetical protein IFM89_011124, partial [Coptis chinensis]
AQLKGLFWKASKSGTPKEFHHVIDEVRKVRKRGKSAPSTTVEKPGFTKKGKEVAETTKKGKETKVKETVKSGTTDDVPQGLGASKRKTRIKGRKEHIPEGVRVFTAESGNSYLKADVIATAKVFDEGANVGARFDMGVDVGSDVGDIGSYGDEVDKVFCIGDWFGPTIDTNTGYNSYDSSDEEDEGFYPEENVMDEDSEGFVTGLVDKEKHFNEIDEGDPIDSLG